MINSSNLHNKEQVIESLKHSIMLDEAELRQLGKLFMKIDKINKYAYDLSQDTTFFMPNVNNYARSIGHDLNTQIVNRRNEVDRKMVTVRERLMSNKKRLKHLQNK